MKLLPRLVASLAVAVACLFSATAFAVVSAKAPQRIEVAFVLDTTGSMQNLIDGAKKKIWAIANAVIDQNPNAEIHMGLVGYRDLGDEYVTKHFPLTTDIQSIYRELLTFNAYGGGDAPESVNEALDVAVTRLGWSPVNVQAPRETVRILFLVGDAPPHMDYEQDRKYPEVIAEAVQRNIIVNTVQAGNARSTTKFWKEMAQLGKGVYHAIPQDGGRVIIIETPYDAEIRIIQGRINTTVIPYGSSARQRDVKSKAALAAAPEAASADMISYLAKEGKGSGKAVTGRGDLVADTTEGAQSLKDVPEAELPEELRKLPAPQREAYVAGKSEERKKLAEELDKLVRQRDQYILEKQSEETKKDAGDSFDRSVGDTLRKQIK